MDVRDGAAVMAAGENAARLPLPGGWVTTAWGTGLHRVVQALDALSGRRLHEGTA